MTRGFGGSRDREPKTVDFPDSRTGLPPDGESLRRTEGPDRPCLLLDATLSIDSPTPSRVPHRPLSLSSVDPGRRGVTVGHLHTYEDRVSIFSDQEEGVLRGDVGRTKGNRGRVRTEPGRPEGGTSPDQRVTGGRKLRLPDPPSSASGRRGRRGGEGRGGVRGRGSTEGWRRGSYRRTGSVPKQGSQARGTLTVFYRQASHPPLPENKSGESPTKRVERVGSRTPCFPDAGGTRPGPGRSPEWSLRNNSEVRGRSVR